MFSRMVRSGVSSACSLLCASLMLTSAAARAQDAAATAEPGSPAPFVAPPVSIKPRPSEMMPKAAQALMLGLANNGEHLFAAGDRGEVLVSNDGVQWAQVATPIRSPLTSITFVDAQNGWAVGHDAVVLHTGDGGKTWQLQNFQPELEKALLDVLFLDTSHGYAVGAYGLFLETTDGGASWNSIQPPEVTSDGFHLYKLARLNNGNLMVAGEQGLIGLSSDGGKTWKKQASIYEGTFFGVAPVGDKGAVLCGLRGNAFYAPDAAAAKWSKLDTGTTNSMFGCAPVDAGHVVMAGLNGTILVADVAANRVTPVRSPLSTVWSAVLPFGGSYVLAGESGVRRVAAQP